MTNPREYDEASLRTLAQGEAIGVFDFELKRAIENCMDVNTDPKAVRTVKLTVKIKPSHDRSSAEVNYQAQASLPADAPGIDHLYLVQTKDGPTAYVHKPQQLSFEHYEQNTDAARADITRLQAATGDKK